MRWPWRTSTPFDEGGPPSPRKPSRILLSIFFVIHFGAIGIYVLPFGPGAYDWLPGEASAWAERSAMEVKTKGLLPAMGYLSMFSLQQHWTLFGPEPIRWANSISAQAYFPDGAGSWTRKQYRFEGPREVGGLKLGRHREWRILSNLGYEGWGDVYRPLMAETLCRRLEAREGQAPSGITLRAEWIEVAIPWRPPPERTEYEQHLGGFDCPRFDPPEPATEPAETVDD